MMPELFLNPALPNYFISATDVTSAISARSFVAEYEDAKVVLFPNLGIDIDHGFWSTLPSGKNSALKKFSIDLEFGGQSEDEFHKHEVKLDEAGIERPMAIALLQQMVSIYKSVLPAYREIFGDYSFDRHQVVWRLNTIRAENMHVDTYKHENKLHFARMFINLDSQPRIWQTSWTIREILARAKVMIPSEELQGLTRGEVWTKLNKTLFGKNSKQWWDNEPRHIAFFHPGDVWIVDSRQVSHQIFYGRRALSIDFSVPKEHMRNREVHYLAIADRFCEEHALDGAVRNN